MAGLRLYYSDSKHTVRHKSGLAKDESDEDFDKFESICSRVYRYGNTGMDPKVGWGSLSIATINNAKAKIEDECRKEKLRLGVSDSLRELIDWRLWHVHKLAQKKALRDEKLLSSGMFT